jgi:ABC-type transport system involved in Fe-S cluster assembly fused permease/ATPase subunit
MCYHYLHKVKDVYFYLVMVIQISCFAWYYLVMVIQISCFAWFTFQLELSSASIRRRMQLRMLENRMLRRIFELKEEEITGEGRK